MAGHLTFTAVEKRFGEVKVLAGVTVEVPLQGVTFVVGKSGSGKSVFCRLAVGLLKPDAGEVSLLGEPVHALPERSLSRLRARAPYLVQGPALLDWLSLEDNVALPLRTRGNDPRAEAAMARVGLLPFRTRMPSEVGPGLRKRTAIARALVLQPEVLLLDEPTTGLDRTAAGQVNETVEVLRAQGLAAVIVSHDYAMVKRLGDSVVEIKDGRVGYQGPATGFLTQME